MPLRGSRSSRGFARVSNKRLTTWALGPGGDDIATLDRTAYSSSASQIIGSAITPVLPNLTVVRLHGHILFNLTAADAQRSGFNMFAGIGVATLDAFTAGAASLPIAFGDADWPGWMWYWSGSIRTSVGALAIGDPSINPLVVRIDSKAMRKLRLNEVLFLMVQAGETGTSTMDVSAGTRVLLKLP